MYVQLLCTDFLCSRNENVSSAMLSVNDVEFNIIQLSGPYHYENNYPVDQIIISIKRLVPGAEAFN